MMEQGKRDVLEQIALQRGTPSDNVKGKSLWHRWQHLLIRKLLPDATLLISRFRQNPSFQVLTEILQRKDSRQINLDSVTLKHSSTTRMAHALILGASGISGWSILNRSRTYPSPTTFSRITGTTNRPLTLEQARIPEDDRIQLVSGVDFTKTIEEVAATLKEKIPDVHTVTHVFFTGK